MQDKELIEALKAKERYHHSPLHPYYAYHPEEHAAILSLLSQQEVVVESDEEATDKYIKERVKPHCVRNNYDFNTSVYVLGASQQSFLAGCQHVRQQLSQQQQQIQYSEEGELLEEMALFIEQVQNSKFYAAMTKEGKQLVYDLLTKYNKLPKQ